MHAMVRHYKGSGAKELMDLLAEREDEVRGILQDVPGLVSYDLVRSDDGGFTVTVCEDKAGTDESLARAKSWLQENASGNAAATPEVSDGSVILHLP